MDTETLLTPNRWAEETFGQAQLQDMRRTRRAVKAASLMARDASASLPKQQETWKEVKAVYRLLDETDVTFDRLMQPHYQQTREQIHSQPVVLLVQDTTEIAPLAPHQDVWTWTDWQHQRARFVAANSVGSRP